MTALSLEKLLKQQIAERLFFQRILSAANSMMLQLHIPPGNHLAFLLDQPDASDNQDAICRWILIQQEGRLVDAQSYPRLISKLHKTLQETSEF